MTKRLFRISAAMTMCLFSTSLAHAGQVVFDFNSPLLASGASNSTIQTYMNSLLTGGASVTVSAGAVSDRTYTGDGHVVGPQTLSGGIYTAKSITLGTSDYDPTVAANQHLSSTTDNFIRNLSNYTGWSFVFSGLNITSVQFDYEIFPDGTCPSTSSCGSSLGGGLYANQPDMTFSTNLGTVFHYYGVTPGGAAPAGNPGNPAGSSWLESPCTDTDPATTGVSCIGTTEPAPQLIGQTALLTSNVAGATTFNFVDWPAMIGIDNLKINYTTTGGGASAVPEPATMLLLGTGLAALARRRKRNKN